MKLRTEIVIPVPDFQISHHDKILMIGSCFVENISTRMVDSGFTVDINPFGILYNPQSLDKGLSDLLRDKKYAENDLFQHQGIYHSFSHHSRFSDIDPDIALKQINGRIAFSSAFLQQATVLVVTFGTAFVYTLKSSGEVVSNCHKLSDKLFDHRRLNISEIVDDWSELIVEMRNKNPHLKIVFTVSPIRHWKDGAHENQLSKSTLLLAIDELIKKNKESYYFPSYEILMDDLRDYRFYAEDMVHPSSQAIDYIWEKFSQTYFDKKTLNLIREWESIRQALNHRPFNPESEEYIIFREKAERKREDFIKANPTFNVE